MAVQTVNEEGLFPGGTKLRVEILPADGVPDTAPRVASLFAQRSMTLNVNTSATRATPTGEVVGEFGSINAIGTVGYYWSGPAITAMRVASNPYRLPAVSYDAWSGGLDSAAEFPFFVRVGPANSDKSKVWGTFMRSFSWTRIAIITDDSGGGVDSGQQMKANVEAHGGTVPFVGAFPTAVTQTKVDKSSQGHLDKVVLIRALLNRVIAVDARIIYIYAALDTDKVALYSALEEAGFLGTGRAIVDAFVSKDLLATGVVNMNGVVHMNAGERQDCAAKKCPATNCGSSCAAPARELNQAYDSVYVLARAIAYSSFQDGGKAYLAGAPGTREKAMLALRATSLNADTAASGTLELIPGETTRNHWNFGYKIWNIQATQDTTSDDTTTGTTTGATTTVLRSVAVGHVRKDRFEAAGGGAITWPGATTTIPQDTPRLDPTNISIGWVIERSWTPPVMEQILRMYAQQAIDEINDNFYVLPRTHLTLEVETVNGNVKTVEAYNAVAARARAAGRPLGAILAAASSHMTSIYNPAAGVDVLRRSTGVPVMGYGTGASFLSDPKKYPNFIRLFPPVTETQHVFRKVALHFGWDRVGLICDSSDSFSQSFFDAMNGTDPSNPSNLQPPAQEDTDTDTGGDSGGGGGDDGGGVYDAERLGIAHAACIDLTTDTNNRDKDDLVVDIKAKDVKVFILFGTGSFIDTVVQYGLLRGIFGKGYQLMIIDSVYPSRMSVPSQAALDGALQVEAASTDPKYPGMLRSSAFWRKHPPTLLAPGADADTPFSVHGEPPTFEMAVLYDAITMAAHGMEACLKEGCSGIGGGGGYDQVMPFFRAAAIDGISGRTAIKAGSNDPQGRLFIVRIGKNPASRGEGQQVDGLVDALPYTFTNIAKTGVAAVDLQVCLDPRLGESCAYRASSPGRVKCFPSSATTIDVTWEPAALDAPEGFLTKYTVTAFAGDEQVVAAVNGTTDTRVVFALGAADPDKRLTPNLVYSVQVVAMYDDATVTSKATICLVPQDGLPCIPPLPPPLPEDDSDGPDTKEGPTTKQQLAGNVRVCGCSYDEFHTKGLPGAPPQIWACERCMPGAVCNGGTAERLVTLPGWYASGNTTLGDAQARPQLWKCPGGARRCPGGTIITSTMAYPPVTRTPSRYNGNRYLNGSSTSCGNNSGSGTGLLGVHCQCRNGSAGMLCDACEDGWISSGVGGGCVQCAMDRAPAATLFIIILASVVGFLIVVVIVARKLTKPSRLERDFVAAPVWEQLDADLRADIASN